MPSAMALPTSAASRLPLRACGAAMIFIVYLSGDDRVHYDSKACYSVYKPLVDLEVVLEAEESRRDVG
jgi:hypothetical protein